MKINNFNITLEWETIRKIPNILEAEYEFPSYNIKVKNQDNVIIFNKYNCSNYEKITEQYFQLGGIKPKLIISKNANKVKTNFVYNFHDNYKKYKEINNKLGFFKNIIFDIDYNNDGKGDFEEKIEYSEIENLEKNLLFSKIYRSSDYLTIKLISNKEYFIEKNIHSYLILSEASNKFVKNKKLNNLFIDNVKSKWLDINQQTMLLTVPFIESDIVEISENLNVKVIPLNYFQSELYKFLIEQQEKEEDINNLYQEYFPNQCFNIGKIYKQAVNNETMIFYQNYIYLFNKDSLETNSLQTDLNINDINFTKYFPLLNKDQTNKTICLSDDLNTDDVIDNIYNLQKDNLGYYSKNMTDYEDIAIDIDYLQNQGVKTAKIIEIEELDDICNIYIEFITSFYNNEKFYIETSNNLKFYEKYKTIIDEKEYITFLFKYSHNLSSLNDYLSQNLNINKSQIISEKDLINFSAKLIF